jgi:ComF family protein
MNLLSGYFHDFIALFFPELCVGCSKNLFKNEQIICTNCIYHLPYTNFHEDNENKVARQLWGRFPFVQAGAYLYFRKGSKVQNIMHQLKYNNKPETGFKMGELYAHTLKKSSNWQLPDMIVPVPLHPKKLKKRSYNQSEYIANGIASVLKVSVLTQQLIRTLNTATQTRKSRFARYENLKEAFIIEHPEHFYQKHILLVDDVITTGATLESCSLALLELENVKISIAAIAFAE